MLKGDVSDMTCDIKQTQKSDISLILELEKQCFCEPYSQNTLTYFYENDAYIITCTSDGVPVGYAVLDLALPDFAEIMRIAVLPENRGKGYADNLMHSLTVKAREYKKKKILLEVRESNIPAISLYKKFGFKTDGVRRNYYKNPNENGILMSLDLN